MSGPHVPPYPHSGMPPNPGMAQSVGSNGLTKDDEDQLRLVTILHYIYAALTGLGGLAVAAGSAFVSVVVQNVPQGRNDPPPELVGLLLGGVGFAVALFLVAHAVAIFFAARFVAERRNSVYCIVIAAIDCLSVPLGTALGIFTLVVLSRPRVKAAFDRNRRMQPPTPGWT